MHPCQNFNRLYKPIASLFGGGGPANPTAPPAVPTANTSAAAAVSQQAMHADVDGQTYASTLLTGAAAPAANSNIAKSVLLGG